jgi:hypothetical protein
MTLRYKFLFFGLPEKRSGRQIDDWLDEKTEKFGRPILAQPGAHSGTWVFILEKDGLSRAEEIKKEKKHLSIEKAKATRAANKLKRDEAVNKRKEALAVAERKEELLANATKITIGDGGVVTPTITATAQLSRENPDDSAGG